MDSTLVVTAVVAGVISAAVLVGLLIDLADAEVRHLPKWAWALIILLGSFPIGAIVYLVVGRVPAAEREAADDTEEPTDAEAARNAPLPADVTDRGRAPAGPPVIVTNGLTKVYGDTVALDRVDLAVPAGGIYGLIGPNGAGKTTILSMLSGLRHPTSGSFDLAVDRTRLGVLPDTPDFEPWLTAFEIVDLARDLVARDAPRERVEAVLVEVGLTEAIHRRTGGFSRGMLQRLGLAACLVGDPEILILDEPTSALDPSGRRELLDLIGRLGHDKTVVLSTHILSDVQQVCDTVAVIDHGQLRFQGPLTDLLARTSSAIALTVRPPADGLRSVLEASDWVSSVDDRGPGRFHVVVTDAGHAEHEIPRLIAERDLQLVAMYPATDLETAFLELTS